MANPSLNPLSRSWHLTSAAQMITQRRYSTQTRMARTHQTGPQPEIPVRSESAKATKIAAEIGKAIDIAFTCGAFSASQMTGSKPLIAIPRTDPKSE
jgi:hypothetical protein